MRRSAAALTAVGLGLAACATQSPTPTLPTAAAPPPRIAGPAAPNPFAVLSGWLDDDHPAALRAFRSACRAAHDPALAPACAAAASVDPGSEAAARAFFERFFRPQLIGGEGLLTAYFTPIYEARRAPSDTFTAPVRPRPSDAAGVGAVTARDDRAAIEARPASDALAWMRPEELFFLQIQGSGVLVFPGGERAKAMFDGANGAPFVAIGGPMRRSGLLTDTSGDAIRAWLAAHRGKTAREVMDLDPRYVFFRLAGDDGLDPAGAAGVTLVPGRAVAIDPERHRLGDLLWIDAVAPTLPGAYPSYRRLVVALDTGNAIKGAVRADLYLGRGPLAGLEAGRVRHTLSIFRLEPAP